MEKKIKLLKEKQINILLIVGMLVVTLVFGVVGTWVSFYGITTRNVAITISYLGLWGGAYKLSFNMETQSFLKFSFVFWAVNFITIIITHLLLAVLQLSVPLPFNIFSLLMITPFLGILYFVNYGIIISIPIGGFLIYTYYLMRRK